MSPFLIILICLILASVVTFFSVHVYNSLGNLKNKMDLDWEQLISEITYRFELSLKYLEIIGNYLPSDIGNNIKNLNLHIKEDTRESVINNYITLEQNLNKMFIILEDHNVNLADWDKLFLDNKMRLDQARDIYNDDVLGMNNKVDLFPFSVIARLGGFKKYTYFRVEN